jgi:hypothetical protein
MSKNELKKAIYLNKPIANFQYINKGSAFYKSVVNNIEVTFDIPLNDMGTSEFLIEMDAKYLLRWLMAGEEVV